MLGRERSSRYKWNLHLLAHEYTLDKKLRTAGMGNTKKRWYLLEKMEMAQEGSGSGSGRLFCFSFGCSFHFLNIKCMFASVYWYLVAFYMKMDALRLVQYDEGVSQGSLLFAPELFQVWY